jgi:hypothetical protein
MKSRLASLGIVLALTLSASGAIVALSAAPAAAVTEDCSVLYVGAMTTTISGTRVYRGNGDIECEAHVYKIHIYLDIREYTASSGRWARVNRNENSCFPGAALPSDCGAFVKYPLSKMKSNACYDVEISGYWVYNRGGTEHRVAPKISPPYCT